MAASLSLVIAVSFAGAADEGKKGQPAKDVKAKDSAQPAKKKDASPSAGIDLSQLKLPPAGYASKLKVSAASEQESGGIRASLSVAPDAFRYFMAIGFEELRKASYGKVELEKKLRELYAKHSKDKGKAIYFLSLSSKGGNDHHFTQTALKDHLLLRGKLKKTLGGFEEDQKPSFAAWQVFEQKSDQRNVLKKNLSEFKSLTFQFTSDQKAGDKEPLTLSVRGLVRVTDRREEQKTDYRAFEGINVGLKQISSSDWKSQTVPEIQFKLYPGQWQNPESPEGFDELLKTLEKNN